MNNVTEGNTNQKILFDNCITILISRVSSYNQIIDNIEISGSDAKIAPPKVLRLPISETATIMIAEMIVFTAK